MQRQKGDGKNVKQDTKLPTGGLGVIYGNHDRLHFMGLMRNTKIVLISLLAVTAIISAGFIFFSSSAKVIPSAKTTHPAATLSKPTVAEKISYDSTLKLVKQLKNNLTGNNLTETAEVFTNILNNYIVPPWIGTPWDFNGVTQAPGKGQIACGYFITTLLRDAGVLLNRVRLAQCASGKIIGTLVQPAYHKNFSHLSFEEFIREIKKKGKGVFIVGLDFHTGFLLNDGNELYFIHSNYIGREGVVKEMAAASAALRASKWRSTGWLTGDERFLHRWVNNQGF